MTTTSLQISFPAGDYEALCRNAHRRGVSRSQLMRHALRVLLEIEDLQRGGKRLLVEEPGGTREVRLYGFVETTRHARPRLVASRKIERSGEQP